MTTASTSQPDLGGVPAGQEPSARIRALAARIGGYETALRAERTLSDALHAGVTARGDLARATMRGASPSEVRELSEMAQRVGEHARQLAAARTPEAYHLNADVRMRSLVPTVGRLSLREFAELTALLPESQARIADWMRTGQAHIAAARSAAQDAAIRHDIARWIADVPQTRPAPIHEPAPVHGPEHPGDAARGSHALHRTPAGRETESASERVPLQSGTDLGVSAVSAPGLPGAHARGSATITVALTPDAPAIATPTRRSEAPSPSPPTHGLGPSEPAPGAPPRAGPAPAGVIAEQGLAGRFVARRLAQYEEVLQARGAASTAREALDHARDGVRAAVVAERAAAGLEAQVAGAFAATYRDPVAARLAFDAATTQGGPEKATATLRRTPEVYGALAAVTLPERRLFRSVLRHDTRGARAGAALAADLAKRASPARAATPALGRVAELANVLRGAEAQAIQAEAAVARLPSGDKLARGIARGVARLDDRAFGALTTALPAHRAALADLLREASVSGLGRDATARVPPSRAQGAGPSKVVMPGAGEGATLQHKQATPRERAAAADVAARAVHHAVQAIAPEELQALIATVRVGAQLVAGLGPAAAASSASVRAAVRTGMGAAFAGREVER